MKGRKVLVELRLAKPGAAAVKEEAISLESLGFVWDKECEPVSIEEQTILIRGTIDDGLFFKLESAPNVVKVWSDSRIEPF